NAIEYLWDFGDVNTDSIANPSHTYDSIGSYTVCLTAINNCLADSVCKQITVVNSSIHEEMKQYNIAVYPNPFKDQATFLFSFNPHQLEQLSLIIFDVFGREVTRIQNITSNKIKINGGNLSTGLYFYKLTEEGQSISTGKFAVQ
ncbi:MAG: T9SS type A sorting domain-containing protein, partial [Bacteroidetes bacterium]|nr:T9SS type A sorting domain-containing protein [Bacteroidota bacterium]